MRNICFTINNYSDEQAAALQDIASNDCRYIICGKEVGESGTPHIQGYAEFHNPHRLTFYKKWMPTAHIEKRLGTRDEAREYCMKEGAYTEFGEWNTGGQGTRTDWNAVHDALKKTPDFSAFREEFPEIAIKYTQGVKAMINDIKKSNSYEQLEREFHALPLYKWEDDLLHDLERKPHDRKIMWYVDPKGGRGKTTFAKYLIGCKRAAYLTNGRSNDLAHAYNGEQIVVFDFCRSNEEVINYQIIESIKNGLVFSPKYDSITKINAIPHVICFSNFMPDLNMLSLDRWDVRELTDASVELAVDNMDVDEHSIEYTNATEIEMADDLTVDCLLKPTVISDKDAGVILYPASLASLCRAALLKAYDAPLHRETSAFFASARTEVIALEATKATHMSAHTDINELSDDANLLDNI